MIHETTIRALHLRRRAAALDPEGDPQKFITEVEAINKEGLKLAKDMLELIRELKKDNS